MGRGRPKKEIDRELFEKLCEENLNRDEICHVLSVSDKTLSGWCRRTYGEPFVEVHRKYTSTFKHIIIQAQKELALSGSSTMLIWLGKQYCGQSEKPTADIKEQEISDEVEALLAELDEE